MNHDIKNNICNSMRDGSPTKNASVDMSDLNIQ